MRLCTAARVQDGVQEGVHCTGGCGGPPYSALCHCLIAITHFSHLQLTFISDSYFSFISFLDRFYTVKVTDKNEEFGLRH